jgi:hypothetical protein
MLVGRASALEVIQTDVVFSVPMWSIKKQRVEVAQEISSDENCNVKLAGPNDLVHVFPSSDDTSIAGSPPTDAIA